ncbi:MAG: ClbS/DfsB family four-helix bundle protein [Pseudomonadota bacterium]
MSNIPKNRSDLERLIETHFAKLRSEFEAIGEDDAQRPCDDTFSIKDILAVRLWWTRAVMDWVEAGRRGEVPIVPAKGYSWRETPALNAHIAEQAKAASYDEICQALIGEQPRLRDLIDSLSDQELTEVGQFEWAERWPVMRWISIGTSSQYAGARTLIRKAMRQS